MYVLGIDGGGTKTAGVIADLNGNVAAKATVGPSNPNSVDLIAIEKEIWLGEMRKRFDILIYDQQHRPWMMVECKEMNIEISEDVLEQVLRYNVVVPVRYVILTNGIYCMGYEKIEDRLELLKQLPAYD